MTLQECYFLIARSAVGMSPVEYDVLSLMVLLHTHEIILASEVALEDVKVRNCENEIVLPAVTQSHAAEIVASLWPASNQQKQHDFWHMKFITESPYESVDDVPDEKKPMLCLMKKRVESSPLVKAVVEV